MSVIAIYVVVSLSLILIGEYVGDFLLQSREVALKKSKSFKALGKHLILIACALTVFMMPMVIIGMITEALMVKFIAGYCILHGLQDRFVWKGYEWLVYYKARKSLEYIKNAQNQKWLVDDRVNSFKYWEDKGFYDTIGLDRLLHTLTALVLWAIFFL
jgi:hypothetical protein